MDSDGRAGLLFFRQFFIRLELLLDKTLEYLYQCDHCDTMFVTVMHMRVHVEWLLLRKT